MSITAKTQLKSIILVVWLVTLLISILVMICGGKIFKKAAKGEKSAYYPLINLFTMLELVDIPSYLGILFFVPGLNLIVISIMSYKLGTVFNTSIGYRLLLVLFPVIFYPLLALSDKNYKLKNEQYYKSLASIKNENINLMTEEEIKQENEKYESDDSVQVDSVFKSEIEMMEKAAPYKAVKIDILGMDKLDDSNNDDIFAPIDRVEQNESSDSEKEKKDDVEVVDL